MSMLERIQRNLGPRRRWMQFSVRTLLIFTTLCAVATWLGTTWHRAQRQERLVAVLTEEKFSDGEPRNKIIYDFQLADQYRRSPNHVPKWLIEGLGIDYFADVAGFESHVIPRKPELDGTALLANLGEFPQLEQLSLFACVKDDSDLALLRGHDKLRILQLTFSNINGTGLDGMKCCRRLHTLSLQGCPVSDGGLTVIANFPGLEELNLSIGNGGLFEPKYSHQGLAHLAELSRLKKLQLAGLDATDADLSAIATIRSLKHLEFSKSPFNDATGAGIRQLAKLTELRSVRLHWDLETTIPRGKLSVMLDALADAQDAKDWRTFQHARASWERLASDKTKVE